MTLPVVTLRDTDPVAWLIACEEIRQLASRYAVTMNHRDLDALSELFVPDVRIGRELTGRVALRDNMAAQLTDGHRTILQVTNHVIDVLDADHATGIVGTRGEIERGDEWVVQVIEYHDTYERRDGHWLFVRRKHHLWYGADMLTRPNVLPDANWPQHQTGKGALPEIMPSWQAWIGRDQPAQQPQAQQQQQ
ncbi:MAG: polyketide cyclase [Ilumatobacteraceae bacterium]|nr:polyketide cyclase [Ilumatobacteraceae bacterium]